MPLYRATVTLELSMSAPDDQQAEEKMDAIISAAEKARIDVGVTVGSQECEADHPEKWETSGPEYEPEIETR